MPAADPTILTALDGTPWRAPSLASADRERVRWGGFEAFARLALPFVPGVPARPLWNWHMAEVCNHFQALYEDRISECVVNIPPGHIKSTLGSVLGPAWVWTIDPSYQFMCATYDDSLSRRLAEYTIAVCRSPWYVERWGDILRPVTNLSEFYTRKDGLRFGSTLLGKGVGRHANLYILDDANKPADAEEQADGKLSSDLRKVNKIIQTSVLTRARPGQPLRLWNVQQRVHEEDASGFLKEKFGGDVGFAHLMLPFKFERDRRCTTIVGGDRRTDEGDTLWPAQIRAAERVVRGKGGWAGSVARTMYQQDPKGGDDRIFHAPTFKRFNPARRPLHSTFSIISVDPTFTRSDKSDFVTLEVWGYAHGDYLCFYSENVRCTFRETVAAIISLRAAYQVMGILVEQAANGFAIVDTLDPIISGMIPVMPRGSKIQRAKAASHHFSAGRVYFAEGPGSEWFEQKAINLTRFPGGAHDDDVDTTSQALLYLSTEFGLDADFEAAADAWIAERQGLGLGPGPLLLP